MPRHAQPRRPPQPDVRRSVLAAAAEALEDDAPRAASEAIGDDRRLKVNTTKTRTHSLLRQGAYWFTMIPNYPTEKLAPLLVEFECQVRRHEVFKKLFGVL